MNQSPAPDRAAEPGQAEVTIDRADVIEMLASFGQRSAEDVPEQIGSLELTWLITKVELEYGVTLELSDDTLMSMTTVTSALTALRAVLTDQDQA
jgi:hypothetical protein